MKRNAWLTVLTLWQREMVRFYRQPSRVIGALGTPFLFWVLIGSGIGTSFHVGPQAPAAPAKMSYLIYFFPGTILMILLFTAIFSTISLIEDRREGFLQSVLVAPVPRSSLVLGKILGGTTLAFSQGVLFLLLAPVIGVSLTLAGWIEAGFILFVIAFALTGLGFIIAWRMHSIQGFHAVMNLFLMPLWFLSGALFPEDGAPVWLRWVMRANPLTYGLSCLRTLLYGKNGAALPLPPMAISIVVTLLFAVGMFVLASLAANRRSVEDFT